MFGLSFLNPLLLLGALASLIPLLIHFLTKKEPPVLFFSTLRFLKEAAEKIRRRWQLRNYLLLLLRMLIILVLALLFARPTLSRTTPAAGWNIALIIDDSPSMAYRGAEQNRFELAKKRAAELIVGAGENSSLLVTALSQAEEAVGPFSKGAALARQKMAAIGLQSRGGNFEAALKNVLAQAARQGITLDRVYFLTDRQEAALAKAETPALLQTLVPVVVLLAGEETYRNAAVLNVEASSAFHFVGSTENFHLELGYWAAPLNTQANVLAVSVDGQKIMQTMLDLQVGKIQRNFSYTFTTPGTHQVSVELEEDGLALDNKLSQTLFVKPAPRVLIVSEAPEGSGSAFYWRQALGLASPQPLVELLSITPAQLSSHVLTNFQLLIYPDLVNLERAERILLEDYVAGGGSLLLIPSPTADLTRLNDELFGANRRYQGFLPALLQKREKPAQPLSLRVEDWRQPIFQSLSEARDSLFGSARFYEYISFRGELAPTVTILARYSDQAPAFCEKSFGAGKVVFGTSALGTDWNNLVTTPEFLPLAYQLTYYLSSLAPADKQTSKTGNVPAAFPTAESDLTLITLKELGQRFPQVNWHFTPPPLTPKATATQITRLEADSPLLVLLLLLLIIEGVLTHYHRKNYEQANVNF